MKKLLTILCVFCTMLILSVGVYAAESAEPAPVSPGLNNIATKMPMAKAGLVDDELYFTADDFERAMNLSRLTSITVTKLPDTSDGELKLGSVSVKEGQTIARANLCNLSFVASDFSVKKSSFEFSINNNPYSTVCDVHFLTYINHTPTLKMASEISLNVSTHRNIAYFGKLSAYDPEGDEIVFEIVKYPEKGVIIMDENTSGQYRYIPSSGYVGNDSFIYVAKDYYGNYSSSACVNIEISKAQTSVVYRDLEGSRYANAALTMTENSIMSGTQIGNDWYFYPEQAVSRAEFLVMAMNAIGITSVPDAEKTVFSDDEYIPYYMKGYVNTAYELGYIKGGYNGEGKLCFSPDKAITCAEAAVILNSMLDLSTPTIYEDFTDKKDTPAWAFDALSALGSAGILQASIGVNSSANNTMTRAEVAVMLSATMQIVNE